MQTITAGAAAFESWTADTPGTIGPGALTYTADATTNLITPASSMASLPDGHAVRLSNVGGSGGGDNSAYVAAVNALSPSAYLRMADASDEVGTYSWTNAGASFGSASLITGDNGSATFNGSVYMFASISDPSWTSLTVIAWVKPSSAADNQTIAGGHAGNGGWVLKLMDDHLQFESTSFSYDVSTTFAYSGGDTLHVAVTFNNSDKTARFYVNGVAKGTAVLPSNLFTGVILAIGTAYGLGATFTGDIDEVAIYGNQQLSGAAILADYELGLEAADPPGGFPEGLNGNDRYYGRWTTEGAGPYHLYPTAADAIAGTNAIDITTAGDGTNTITPWGYGAVPIGFWGIPQRHIVRGCDGVAGRTVWLYAAHTNGIGSVLVSLDDGTPLELTASDHLLSSDTYCSPASRTFTADAGTDQITLASSLTDTATAAMPPRRIEAVRFDTTGALPGGLSKGEWYFTRFTSTSVTKVFPTAWDAAQNTNAINLSNAGSGTHTVIFHGSSYSGYAFLLPSDLSAGWHALRAVIKPRYCGTERILQGGEDDAVSPTIGSDHWQAQSLVVYGDIADDLDYYAVVSGTGSSAGTPAVQRLRSAADPTAVTGRYATISDAWAALDTHAGGGRIYLAAGSYESDIAESVTPALRCQIRPLPGIAPGAAVIDQVTTGQNIVATWIEYRGVRFTLDATDPLAYVSFGSNYLSFFGCEVIGPGMGTANGGLVVNATGKSFWVRAASLIGSKGGSWFQGIATLALGTINSHVTGDQYSGVPFVRGFIVREFDQVGAEHADITQFLGPIVNMAITDGDVDLGSGNDVNSFLQGDATSSVDGVIFENIRLKGSGAVQFSMGPDNTHVIHRHITAPLDPLEGMNGDDHMNCEVSGCLFYAVAGGAWPSPPAWNIGTAEDYYKRIDWTSNHNVDGTLAASSDTTGDPGLDANDRPDTGSDLIGVIASPRRKFDLDGNTVGSTDNVGAFANTPASVTWKSPRTESELVLGLYLFCGDGVGGASGNCGVATNVFNTEFEDFLTNGYNNPSTGDDALDNCIALGYEDVMLGWPFGLTASGSEYQIGTVAPTHPDEGDTILSSPYDQKQFTALATNGAAHISAMKTALLARAANLRAPIIYQGSPKYDQAITNAALDETIEMAIDLIADVALDASGECTRASATLPVVALVTRLTGTHGLRYIAEAWGRDDVEDCREWLTLAASTIATGSDGTDTAYRADLAISDANNGWMKPEFIRSYGIRPIVLIAYNGNSVATRKGYIRFWLNMGCSVYFDPIGFTTADLTEIRQYFLSRRGGTFRKISTRQRD